MENLVNMQSLFGGVYSGKKVMVTGHTGFKGSWLALWLHLMGARVYGYALKPPSIPSHIDLLKLNLETAEDDIRNPAGLLAFMQQAQPDIVFHLAAQALVRESYADPVNTYSTNVMGTLHVLEATRKTPSVKAVVNVTSDKCYENKEWIWGYRENDEMGGFDPYSSSKGCAELLTASYRNAYYPVQEYKKSHHVLLASARAGNVIGGGDWATDRLIPDMVKAAAQDREVVIRNPKATRPWQHVLEPLSGYLMLGWKLLEEKKEFAEGWNFGPYPESNVAVEEVITAAAKHWPAIRAVYSKDTRDHHEANLLMLDCSKANKLMKWKPVWDMNSTMEKTIGWYKRFYSKNEIQTAAQIREYVSDAGKSQLIWTR